MELVAFDMRLQESKQEMDSVIWMWVNKAVVSQLAFLYDIDIVTGGAMVIMSEMKEEDY
jgi:hypothetical protein